MKNNIREILDETNINIVDELNILEYIDELEKIKEEYTKSLDKLDVLENRIDKAIDIINDKLYYDDRASIGEWCGKLEVEELLNLSDILRGEDNENNSCN